MNVLCHGAFVGRSALYSVFWIRGRTKGLIIFMFLASGCVVTLLLLCTEWLMFCRSGSAGDLC
jgi:hypothetical protein